MNAVQNYFSSLRALDSKALSLLTILAGGHFVIHWFQQFFPVVLPSIKATLNLSNVQVGALTSVQQMVHGVGQLPLGMIADSMVRHRGTILALSLVSMGAGYFLLGTASVLGFALLGSALIGLGTSLWHPAAAASLSNRFPERRATALAIHGTGATISDTLTPLGVGFLLVTFPWQTVTWVQLFTGLLFGFIVWRALKGMFADAGGRTSFSRTQISEIVALVKNPAFMGVSASTGLLQMGRLVVLTFLPIYLREHLGYSAFALGVYVALMHVLGIFSQAVLGALSDRFGRKAVLVPSCVTLGFLFGLLAVVPAGIPLGLVIVAIGLFFYTLFNVMNAAVMDVAGSSIQASSYGLTYMIMQVIVIPTPMATGWLIGQFGMRWSFFLAGAFLVLGGLVLLPLELYRGTKGGRP